MSAPKPPSYSAYWLIALAVSALVIAAIVERSGSSPVQGSSPDPAAATAPKPPDRTPFVDEATLYRSAATEFVARAEQVKKRDSEIKVRGDDTCELKAGAHRCVMYIELLIYGQESWEYDLKVDAATGCWTARTVDRFGGAQEDIDDSRNREWLAPSKAEVRKLVREANALHNLDGCVEQLPAYRHAGGHATKFMAGLASIDVQGKFPGAQRRTSCRSKGKDVVDMGFDSHDFSCATTLANGRRYVSEISCLDDPPYSDYGGCSEEDDYPRPAPRPLP